MKKQLSLIALLFIAIQSFTYCSQDYKKYLDEAKKYDSLNQNDKAIALYIKAADLGSAEAHFALSRYTHKDERIYHLTEAAKLGHSRAYGELFSELIFCDSSLTKSNFKRLIDIYHLAEKSNTEFDGCEYQEVKFKKLLDVLCKCQEAEPFDANSIIREYNLNPGLTPFEVWNFVYNKLNADSSNKITPKLLLQIVSRGGTEANIQGYVDAIDDFYAGWKNNELYEFDRSTYLGALEIDAEAKDLLDSVNLVIEKRIKVLYSKFNASNKILFDTTFLSADKYFDNKTYREEESCTGIDHSILIAESYSNQRLNYIKLVENIINGYLPNFSVTLSNIDKKLNEKYQSVRKLLEKVYKPDNSLSHLVCDPNELKIVELLWIDYRDKSSKLFANISTNKNEDFWKAFLTQERIKALNDAEESAKEWE